MPKSPKTTSSARGRPSALVDAKTVSMVLDRETLRILSLAGSGNRSEGVRRLAQWYLRQTAATLGPIDWPADE
jgi:hypothetical protein